MPPPDLLLPARAGLPDSIAYLRARYPQSGWRSHARFGQLADFWLHVHAALRAEAAALGELNARARGDGLDPAALPAHFVPPFNAFLGHLDAHHRIEDAAYFPKFRALDPRMAAAFDLLENDHHRIDAALHAALETARAMVDSARGPTAAARSAIDRHADAFTDLTTLLDRHLADEEEIVIPAMLEHGERSVS
ncbi:hemerythrin domain-containing protein [Sphingomonas japonica]|uniref:Iron-sulfur cluster repair protein YtfE (RIC family) n=1 Tax=Sphingomonas japonica TaxID=511662 RepID=A0ABX0U1X8_9SPHN|nr:hemerythrin domain-containing protein [Sphingomonas japonica]NIJ23706.1 iron-sulfur cluster repair protein YtfE (RIC family) [Sphingomonas japonica]